jgi:hypothetical protein
MHTDIGLVLYLLGDAFLSYISYGQSDGRKIMHDELEGMRTEGISVFLKSSVPKFAWKD